MHSPQELSTTTSSCSHEESDGQSSIAAQIDSRKRKHSKISADSEEELGPNYDILQCFPPLLCRYVFSHFNAKEMLEMSTVSREWNKFVGERPQVEKLRLNFLKVRPKPSRSDKNILLNSERKYQKIAIALERKVSQFGLEVLAQRAGAWKSVNIHTRLQNDLETFRKVLEIVEPTVEELRLFNVNYLPAESFTGETSWTFPCLKSFSYVNGFCIFKPFVHVASLVKISLSALAIETNAAEDLLTILRNNHNLKEMTINCDYTNLMEFPTDFKFKLQTLAIHNYDDEEASKNFAAFLATQAETLESLELSDLILDRTHLELILNMPKLKSLEIDFPFSDDVRIFPKNTSIESFRVHGNDEDEIDPKTQLAYHNLIRAMPSLKHFRCNRVDAELIFCLMEFSALESIYTDVLDILRVPECDVFPNLKIFVSYGYPLHFEYPTADHNFAKLVKKDLSS